MNGGDKMNRHMNVGNGMNIADAKTGNADMNDAAKDVSDDPGAQPYVINIEKATLKNRTYRTVLWTGNYLQLTVMSIRPGSDIGLEIHPDTDQFIRVEQGHGLVQMGSAENNLDYQKRVSDGYAILVPAGTWHNVINIGDRPLKLYTLYAPPHHPRGTIHKTKADAIAAED